MVRPAGAFTVNPEKFFGAKQAERNRRAAKPPLPISTAWELAGQNWLKRDRRKIARPELLRLLP